MTDPRSLAYAHGIEKRVIVIHDLGSHPPLEERAQEVVDQLLDARLPVRTHPIICRRPSGRWSQFVVEGRTVVEVRRLKAQSKRGAIALVLGEHLPPPGRGPRRGGALR